MPMTFLALAAGLASTASVVAYDGPTASQWACTVGCASRQPMLSQKMAKEFLLIAAGCDTESNRLSLSDSISEFDQSLSALRYGCAEKGIAACQDERTRKYLDEAVSAWGAFKPVVQGVADGGTPTGSDVEFVSENNMPLMAACEKSAKSAQSAAAKACGVSNPEAWIASRTSALTQQMAKEFALIFLGQDAKEQQSSLRDNVKRFETFMGAMANGDSDLGVSPTDEKVSGLLRKIQSQWSQFHDVIAKGFDSQPSKSDLSRASKLSDGMLTNTAHAAATLGGFQSSTVADVPDSE